MFSARWLLNCAVFASVWRSPASTAAEDSTLQTSYTSDAILTTPELVWKSGYPAESHTVITDDGYILTIHRIPHGKSGPSENRPVVLLQHGLLCSSAVWVLSEPQKGLGYVLADAGYDVWLGNYRGNTYGRNHTSLKATDSRFWQFSWHESGVYDLPAMIDYVLEVTDQSGLYYVGHSMGNTGFYVMASTRPEYNTKVRGQFSLAPVAFMGHVKSPVIRLMSAFQDSIELLLGMIGVDQFTPNNEFMEKIVEVVCPDGAPTQTICTNIIFLMCGFDEEQFNTTLLPAIFSHVPAGSSTKQMLHYSQDIHSRKFRQYDHGAIRNLLTYGSISPPEYDLSKITAPVFLYWSDNDWLAAVQDVKELEAKLPNVKLSRRVDYEKFNHVDHMWAIDVLPLVYNNLLSDLAAS